MTILQPNPSYDFVHREELPDIHAEGILLRHKKSGARIALIPCEDRNKVFYIAFRTPPTDSTGAAHIVEHTVLCGSEKYPLKDPFIELLKGSLNTYLNATTYPDKTMYPVASTNQRDFRNLVDVYLDAVFHPAIYKEKNIFRQEGWSFRMETEEDPLTLSGVVYNEMKGAYSSPDEIMDRTVFAALFPDTPYAEESGGDPDHIPELTYDAFLDFHRKYYHPSNSYIYFYGDFDPEETLRYLDETYLSFFEMQDIASGIAEQPPFAVPKTACVAYPVAGDETEEENSYLSLNFVTEDREDMTSQIAVDILDYALFSMPGAAVRQAVLDRGIGDEVYGSYSDGIAQPYFSIVAKNAAKEEFSLFRETVLSAISKAAAEGIDRDALLAGIGSLEFQFREADYATWPKGLIYGIDMMDSWLYDDEAAFEPLRQLRSFEELRRHSEAGDGYFEDLLQRKFLENPFRADVILYPQKGLQEKKDRENEQRLQALKASMSDAQIEEIVDCTHALREYQEREESEAALALLPTLHISDLEREPLTLSNIPRVITEGSVSVNAVRHEAASNGIGYTQLLFSAQDVPEEKLVYLALLRSALLNVDTDEHTYAEMINRINARTGGISCGITVFSDPEDRRSYKPYFALRGRALYSEEDFLNECFSEILVRSNFTDPKRIREILSELHSRQEMILTESGHSTAVMRALSYDNPESAFHDAVSGIRFQRSLSDLYDHFEEKKEEIMTELQALAGRLFRPEKLIISYTCEEKAVPVMESGLRSLLRNLMEGSFGEKSGGESPRVIVRPLGNRKEGFFTAGQVQHVAVAGNFAEAGYRFSGILHVLRHILNYGYLWERIRTDGNAYGCGASFTRNGCGSLMSFRDPNLTRTLDVYRELPDYVASFEADEEEMEKYIIGTVSSLDTPLTASLYGSVCMRAYLNGTTQEQLRREREEVLSATAEEIRATEGLLRAMLRNDAYCVVGSESMLRKHEAVFGSLEPLL